MSVGRYYLLLLVDLATVEEGVVEVEGRTDVSTAVTELIFIVVFDGKM